MKPVAFPEGGGPQRDHLGTAEVVWRLEDLYGGRQDPALADDIKCCEHEALAIHHQYAGKVKDLTARELADLTRRLESLDATLAKIGAYAFLDFATRLDNAEASALEQKAHELASRCETETVFFKLEWNEQGDDKAAQLFNQPELAHYRHYLQQLRAHRPHLLSLAEERLLAEKEAVGRNSWTSLFDKVLGHATFGRHQRSEEEVLADLHHPERRVRRRAAADLTAGLRSHHHILTHIANTLAAEKMISDRLRRHPGWLDAMNLENQLRGKTVATMIEAISSRYDLVHRYYRRKRQMLGVRRLEHYDRYAPLPALPTASISWGECQRMVLEAFADFSPEMAAIAGDFFEKGWIHAPVQRHKRGGAFAHPVVPAVHPYLLVNYTGNFNDVSTVAHELGHGIHQVLAARQGFYNSDTPVPLAETASVFAELLLFEKQLSRLTAGEERRAFICQKIEAIFATVFRQTAMNQFEALVHEGRRSQGELSGEQFGEFWMTTQGRMFGDAIHLGDEYRLWWSYIPHFLETPGYVYSYAFGELLVLALWAIYRREGQGFVSKYLELLAAGGSRSPYELLRSFAIDLDSPEFWMEGLAVIEEMVRRVE